MKKLLYLVAAMAALCSCEPSVFNMLVERREPSVSGINLSGKTMSVVYMDDLSGKDTVFNAGFAQGFAQALEEDYFDGKEAVAVYRMEKDMAGNYADRDTLVGLAVESADDVVFLADSPEFGKISLGSRSGATVMAQAPFQLRLYAYDTMELSDSVRVFAGSSKVGQNLSIGEDADEEQIEEKFYASLYDAGSSTGKAAAKKFLSNWSEEQFYFYYYDSYSWDKASVAAYDYRWREAIDLWMALLENQNPLKRAALEYNIATAFYLLGDNELSAKWLDLSDKDNEMPLSSVLRRKLSKK